MLKCRSGVKNACGDFCIRLLAELAYLTDQVKNDIKYRNLLMISISMEKEKKLITYSGYRVLFLCFTACNVNAQATAAEPADIYMKVPQDKFGECQDAECRLLSVDCAYDGFKINQEIFGIAYSARHMGDESWIGELNPASRRWGGNPTSRYNWKIGNVWNTAQDWYFKNVAIGGRTGSVWREFVSANQKIDASSYVTVPMIGWVAKDGSSYSFSVKKCGEQTAVAPENRDAGNGIDRYGRKLLCTSPAETSVAVNEVDVAEWVNEIRKVSQDTVISLDNEPMLWHVTHRDIHPEPVSYDEIMQSTRSFALKIKEKSPDIAISGPSAWGWMSYFYSAVDAHKGVAARPDRRSHQDIPFLEWYLSEIKKYEATSGVRLVDFLDVHYYPQAKGVYSDKSDRNVTERRVQAVRALWDYSYLDGSWINEPIALLPRMMNIINDNHPEMGLIIGEYSFGGERDISGGLALAEALGLFAVYGVQAAYYWTYPPRGSYAYWAFRMYRNFDGKKSVFGNRIIKYAYDTNVSIYVARNGEGDMSAVVVNRDQEKSAKIVLDLQGCSAPNRSHIYSLLDGGGRSNLINREINTSDGFSVPARSVSTVVMKWQQ